MRKQNTLDQEWKLRLLTNRVNLHQTAVYRKATAQSYTKDDILPGYLVTRYRKEVEEIRRAMKKA